MYRIPLFWIWTNTIIAPTRAEVQTKLDNPCYGRGGRMMSVKFVEPPLSNQTSSDNSQAGAGSRDYRHLALQCVCSWLKALCQHLREVTRSNPSASAEGLREQLVNELNFTQYTKKMFQAETIEHFNFRKHLQDQHWPSNVDIPNANFARKHRLVVGALRTHSPWLRIVFRSRRTWSTPQNLLLVFSVSYVILKYVTTFFKLCKRMKADAEFFHSLVENHCQRRSWTGCVSILSMKKTCKH